MQFQGKVVVVTGGGGGIGLAAAREFAREGATVAINDLREEAVAAAVTAVEQAGGRAIAIPGDIASESAVESNARSVLDQLGRIDVLIANAGLPVPGRAESYEGWDRSIAVNLSGHFYWARAVARESMIPNGGGAIVFTSSGAGLFGVLNDVGYVTAKHAIVGLTKALALEWTEFGIRVNCVAPGVIGTPMVRQALSGAAYETRTGRVPMRRMGEPGDIARTMVFLASDAAAYITGVTLPVDGGQGALHSGMPAHRAPPPS